MGSRSSTSQSIPKWALPYAQQYLRTGAETVAPGSLDASGNLNTATAPLKPMDPALQTQVAGFTPDQLAGMGLIEGSAGGQAGVAGAGIDQFMKTLGGDYLDPSSNPYLSDTFNQASRAVTDQYRNATAPGLAQQAMQAGVSGGSAENQQRMINQYGLGQNLNDLATQIYGGNYQTERGRQDSAMGNVGAMQQALSAPGQSLLGVGTLQQGQQQTALDVAQQNAQLGEQYPLQQLSYLTNLLGGITGSGGVVTSGTSK